MSIKVNASDLQTRKYVYARTRTEGDARYSGRLDRERVSKVELYEVVVFIENFMNKHGLTDKADIHAIEDAIHQQQFSKIVMRDELIKSLEHYFSIT